MIFDPILDIFRGRAVTIPPMDGALKPNTALDEAPVALEVAAPDNLCQRRRETAVLLGRQGLRAAIRQGRGGPELRCAGDRAGCFRDRGSRHRPGQWRTRPDAPQRQPARTAGDRQSRLPHRPRLRRIRCALRRPGFGATSPFGLGGRPHEQECLGSVWRIDLTGKGGAALVLQGLGFPNGLLVDRDSVIVSEAWQHRVVRLSANGTQKPILEKLRAIPPGSRRGRRRRLAGPVRAAQPADRVHAAGKRLSRADDARRAAGILDRPALASETSFLEPLQMRRREDHGHPQTLVAVALLWPGGEARCKAAAGGELPQPRQRTPPRRDLGRGSRRPRLRRLERRQRDPGDRPQGVQ